MTGLVVPTPVGVVPPVGLTVDAPVAQAAVEAAAVAPEAGPAPEPVAHALLHPAVSVLLGLAWAVVVGMLAAGALRRTARRLPRSAADSRPFAGGHDDAVVTRRPAAIVHDAVAALGAAIRRMVGPMGQPPPRVSGTARSAGAGVSIPASGRITPGGAAQAGHVGGGAAQADRRAGPGAAPGGRFDRAPSHDAASSGRVPSPMAATVGREPSATAEPGRATTGVPATARSDDDLDLRDQRAADRRTGWAALASGFLLLVAPALAAAPVTWAVAMPVLAARRGHARHEAALADQLPDVVDLLALTAAAGLPVGAALGAIGPRPGGPLGAALARASVHVRHGGSTADALLLLGDVGPAARPLVDALVQHDRYGTPLLPALERVAAEARARRRRRSEEAARRLPVTLLFPLVLTTFPAFVLLTVVPLLAGSLGSLSLSPT